MTVYKYLHGREATHVPGFRYRLRVWQPPVEGPLVACENGYHVLRSDQVAGEFIGRDLFVAEIRGDTLEAFDKIVAREARIVEHLTGWNERTARLFAADCAERVLPVFEAERPDDDRPRLAIQAARDYANGVISNAAWAAAGDAAWAAVKDAARAAADAAARAAAGAAGAAAGAAARDAAWAAVEAVACAAAEAAARATEREWQSARLLDYAHGRIGEDAE